MEEAMMTTRQGPKRDAQARLGISHRNNVTWYMAPLPRRWHRCAPWTVCVQKEVERCACGGVRLAGGRWFEKNERRRRGSR